MKKYFVIFVSLCFLVSFGCGGQPLPDGMPSLSPFEIVITQEGKPLEGATVFLHSDAVPYVMGGKTNTSGVASMSTQSYRGVPEGEFKVTVFKEVSTPSQYGETPPGGEAGPGENQDLADLKAFDEWTAKRKKEYRPTHSYVHKKYASKDTTDLTVTTTGSKSASLEVGPAVDDLSFPDDSATKPSK